MTKEEFKKEAEESSFKYTLDKPWVCEVERKQIMAHFEKGYLEGAEPREKQIEELQEELEQAEKVKVVEHFEAYGQCRDSRRIADLEAQIEKMKCCSNCRHSENDNKTTSICDECFEMCYWELRR